LIIAEPGRVHINDQKMPNLAQVTLAQWGSGWLSMRWFPRSSPAQVVTFFHHFFLNFFILECFFSFKKRISSLKVLPGAPRTIKKEKMEKEK
jgi:hypothetical protein